MIDKNKAEKLGIKILDSKKEQNPLYENLKVNFPQTIDSDGKPNFETIAMLLGMSNKRDIQGYELTFVGKGLANALYSTPTTKDLVYDAKQSISKHFHKDLKYEEDSKNLTPSANAIICGDNLDVLKILKSAYYEKIKMIYIDPPYNTRNDDFTYKDDFTKEEYKKILLEVGLLIEGEDGKWVESEELKFFRNVIEAKSHSGWLSFMLPRLKLARDLLREDGVIFISIDDNEQANLKILCDEIFGEENFVADFIRKTKSTTNDAKTGLNYQHEFLLCYAKDKESANLLGGQKDLSKYKNPDNDPNGEWTLSDPSAKNGKMETNYFAVINPYTGKEDYPPKGMFWRFSKNTMQKHIDEGRICFKKDHKENERGFIYKRYLKDLKTTYKTFDSLVFTDNLFMNQKATKDLIDLDMVEYFTYPKGVEFIKTILNHSTNDDSELVLDFFAGSGTTAQAVMELNAEDGGNRKFILVQLPEPIDKDKNKTAYDFVKNELGRNEPTISDITIERVKRAGAKITKTHKDFQGDLGFSVYRLCNKPNLVCNKEGHLKLFSGREGATSSDIARNLSLQCGKGLDKELKCIIESKLYKCDDMYCVVKCDDDVLEILGDTKNEYIFINGYADIKLEHFLNLKNSANINERLRIVY